MLDEKFADRRPVRVARGAAGLVSLQRAARLSEGACLQRAAKRLRSASRFEEGIAVNASDTVTIAVDAMGGDNAPDVVLEGCARALSADPALSIVLTGPAEVVEPFAAAHERCTARATTEVIEMGEHPAKAVRRKKDSSIVVGCRLVKDGEAQGFFTAGSTGACLAAGTLVIGRAKGVARPALVVVVPSPARPVVFADVGANADCKPAYLLQFAKMASVFAERVVGVENPRVALLNIGEEETKGSAFAQDAHKLLRDKLATFVGNAEGRDLVAGTFDVVVTDGFTGNVALKTMEGTIKVLFGELKGALTSSFTSKLGALTIKGPLADLKHQMDPDTYGGSPLIGLKGACIVGHGSSSARAVKNGIATAAKYVRTGVSDAIEEALSDRSFGTHAASEHEAEDGAVDDDEHTEAGGELA